MHGITFHFSQFKMKLYMFLFYFTGASPRPTAGQFVQHNPAASSDPSHHAGPQPAEPGASRLLPPVQDLERVQAGTTIPINHLQKLINKSTQTDIFTLAVINQGSFYSVLILSNVQV